MTACHLVTHRDLTLLGNIDLSHLHDTRGKVIAYRDIVLLAAQFCLDLFLLAEIVHDTVADHIILVGIRGPLAQIDRIVIDIAEDTGREFRTLGNDVSSQEVLHTLRCLARCQRHELVDKNILERFKFCFILFVKLGKKRIGCLALLLGCT